MAQDFHAPQPDDAPLPWEDDNPGQVALMNLEAWISAARAALANEAEADYKAALIQANLKLASIIDTANGW